MGEGRGRERKDEGKINGRISRVHWGQMDGLGEMKKEGERRGKEGEGGGRGRGNKR